MQLVTLGQAVIDGTGAAAIESQSGIFASLVDNGAGDYTLNLDGEIRLRVDDTIFVTQDRGAGDTNTHADAVERVSASQLRVRLSAIGGAGTDGRFQITICRVRRG